MGVTRGGGGNTCGGVTFGHARAAQSADNARAAHVLRGSVRALSALYVRGSEPRILENRLSKFRNISLCFTKKC